MKISNRIRLSLTLASITIGGIAFAQNDRPTALDFYAVEVSTSKGAPMTVERTIPNINNVIVDLG